MTKAKRILLACLALLLLCCPVMMAAAAETDVIDVYITESAPTVDGVLSEFQWYVDYPLSALSAEGAPTAYAGFMWDKTGLYVAVSHDGAESITLTLGEASAVYDVTAGTFTENGLNAAAAVSGNTAEFVLPFAVTQFEQQVAFGLTVADSAGTAGLGDNVALCMRADILLVADGCVDKTNAGYVRGSTQGTYSKVTFTQGDGLYECYAPAETKITNGIRRNMTVPDNAAMDVEFTVKINELPVIPSSYAWRGWNFELRGSFYQRRVAFNKDADGVIYFNTLHASGSQRIATTLKEGDTVVVRMEFAEDNTAVVYLNGEKLADVSAMDADVSTAKIKNCLEISVGHYNWTSGATDVDLYGYCVTRPGIESETDMISDMLDGLTFDTIKAENTAPDNIISDLDLPDSIPFEYLSGDLELTWTSSRPDIISADGTVTRPDGGTAYVTLTATAPDGQSRSFTLSVRSRVINAYITETVPTLDGIPGEFQWFVDHTLSDLSAEGAPKVDAGVMWDENNLYVAVSHDGAETITLTLGGQSAVYDVVSGAFTSNGLNAEAAVSDNAAEFALPISVSAFDQQFDFDLSVADSAGTASFIEDTVLCMRSSVLFVADGCVDKANAGYVQGSVYGSYNKVTFTQQEGAYRFYAPAQMTITNGIRRNIPFPGGAMDVEFTVKINELPVISDLYAWRGFLVDIRNDSTDLYRFTLNKGADGVIYFNALYEDNVSHRTATTLKEGDVAAVRIEVAKDKTAVAYLNGVKIAELPAADATVSASSKAKNCVELGVCHYNWVSGTTDVELYGYQVIRPVYETASGINATALDRLTFDDIRNENVVPEEITGDLTLPAFVNFPYLEGETVALTWTCNLPDVISASGEVTRPESGAVTVTVTATTPDGQYKDFVLTVIGKTNDNGGKLIVEGDTNPAAGVGVASEELMFTLDTNNNSVVLDLGAVSVIDTVKLTDMDTFSRLNRESLTLWVSSDNVTYTEVENYKLFQSGLYWYLYDFTAAGRYVKVHYTHFDGTAADFIAPLSAMISAWNDGGAAPLSNGGQWEETPVTLTNNTDTKWQDKAVVIPGVTGDGSARVLLDGETLFHYLNGTEIVVRIPDLEAGESVQLTVLTGNGSALDIASKESVYEVTYGTRESVLTENGRWCADIPAGLKFPNGDVAPENMVLWMVEGGVKASFDGGRTWSDYGTIPSEIHSEIYGSGDKAAGGWIIDDVSGRICYHLHKYTKFEKNDITQSYSRNAVIYSDDGGKTWALADLLEADTVEGITFTYCLSYNDGIRVNSTYDGADGPGVDYLFNTGAQYDNLGSFCGRMAYSCDGGMTWQYSTNLLIYGDESSSTHIEGGVSEGTILENEDGTILFYARSQAPEVDYFAQFYSDDGGVTWYSDNDKDGDNFVYGSDSSIYTTNTQPIMQYWDFDGDGVYEAPILTWGGNTLMGGSSYRRTPYNVAISYDGLETWVGIQNMFFETFMDIYNAEAKQYVTNQSLAQAGDTMTTTFLRYQHKNKVQIIADNFNDWFYRTKGGYDTFENGSVRADGWSVAAGTASVTRDHATDGSYSMQLNQGTDITRSVPYLQNGRVVMNVYNTGADFTIELQAAYNPYGKGTPVAIAVSNGVVSFVGSDAPTGLTLEAGWNTIAFELKLTEGAATLSVNDGTAVAVPVAADVGNYVCYITFDTEGAVYVDEVFIESDLDAVRIQPAPSADKTALQEAVDEAEALAEEDYTSDTWADMENALETAKEVLADESATQEEVDAAKAALDAAVAALERAVTLVAEPTVKGSYTYTGSEQIVEMEGVEPCMSVSGNKATNAGDHEITITLADGYAWADGADGKITWTIAKAQAVITVDTTPISVIYGETVTLPEATTNFGTVACDKTAADLVNVGEHTVTYTVEGTENYEGATAAVKVTVAAISVAEPTVKGNYTYTGSEQTVELEGFENSYMTITGNKATNAGDHEITITLADGYAWADGADGKITWTISKAQAVITVDTTPITVTYGETVTLPTATTNFGTVTCDKTAAELVNAGEYTVTYTVEDGDNWNGAIVSIPVSVAKKAATLTALDRIIMISFAPIDFSDPVIGRDYKAEGLVDGDTVEVHMSCDANMYRAGNYTIVITAENNNYDFTLVNGTLTVVAGSGGVGGTTPGGTIPGTQPVVCNCHKFTDVNINLWYHEAVCFAVNRGIMNGTGDSTFSPSMNLSRAMMMTMLARLDGVDTSGGSTWYEKGMKWAVDNGISDGTNPNGQITREQMVTMLYRYAGSPAVSENLIENYKDADQVSSWAVDAMNWAVANGIIQGKGDNILDPKGAATRAEVAQILYKYLTI